jgi:dUTP pyrophosphatase
MNNILKVKKIDENACLPEYSLDCDVAFDIRSNETIKLDSLEIKEIKTGVAIEIPNGYIGLIRDRFGIVTKIGLHVIAGTIDSSFREELTVVMTNIAVDEYEIEKGMKIAQIVIIPVNKLNIEEVSELSKTKRKDNC